MRFSIEEKKNFNEGFYTAKSDFSLCKSRKEIENHIKIRSDLKKLSISRKDKNGVSFNNGYLTFLRNKLNKMVR